MTINHPFPPVREQSADPPEPPLDAEHNRLFDALDTLRHEAFLLQNSLFKAPSSQSACLRRRLAENKAAQDKLREALAAMGDIFWSKNSRRQRPILGLYDKRMPCGGATAKSSTRLNTVPGGGTIVTRTSTTSTKSTPQAPAHPLPCPTPHNRYADAPPSRQTPALKKLFLSQYADNEREIKRLEEEICRWESRAQKMTSSFSLTPSHCGEDRLQSAVDEMVELRNLLYDRLVDSTELRRQIALAISTVPERRLKLLLEYRYIDGQTWEEVASTIACDYRWTLRLHDRALAMLIIPDGAESLF